MGVSCLELRVEILFVVILVQEVVDSLAVSHVFRYKANLNFVLPLFQEGFGEKYLVISKRVSICDNLTINDNFMHLLTFVISKNIIVWFR